MNKRIFSILTLLTISIAIPLSASDSNDQVCIELTQAQKDAIDAATQEAIEAMEKELAIMRAENTDQNSEEDDDSEIDNDCPPLAPLTPEAAPALQKNQCPTCNKSFTTKSILTTHMKLHTGVRPFECDQCGKTFITKDHLKSHQRTHSGEKPFECYQCGKRCGSVSGLTTHARTHSREKPYICNVCGSRFTVNSSLRRHMREQHPQQDLQAGPTAQTEEE